MPLFEFEPWVMVSNIIPAVVYFLISNLLHPCSWNNSHFGATQLHIFRASVFLKMNICFVSEDVKSVKRKQYVKRKFYSSVWFGLPYIYSHLT